MSDLIEQLAAYGGFHEDRQTAPQDGTPSPDDVHAIELRLERPGGLMSGGTMSGGPMRSRAGLVVAGAAAAVIAVIALIVAGGGDPDADDTVVAVPEEVEVIAEFVDALDAEDVDRALSLGADELRADVGEGIRALVTGRAPANPERVVGPCDVDAAPGGPATATCALEYTDDFQGPAVGPSSFTWVVSVEDGVVLDINVELSDAQAQRDAAFLVEFWRFLRSNHRDVYDAIAPPVLNPLTRLAMTVCADGSLSAAGYDGDVRLTAITSAGV